LGSPVSPCPAFGAPLAACALPLGFDAFVAPQGRPGLDRGGVMGLPDPPAGAA